MAQKKRLTQAEYDQLYERLYEQKEDGTVTDSQLSVLLAKLDSMRDDGASKAEIEKELLHPARVSRPAKDPGTRAAEKSVTEIEKKLRSVYGTAAVELKKRLASLEKDYSEKLKKKQKDLQEGKITQAQYDAWVRSTLMRQQHVRQQIDQCTGTLLNANEKALGMVNGEQLHVFAENANYQEYQIDKATGMNLMFTVYDDHAVERLIRDNPDLLPPKKVNGKKDKAWNQGHITAAVTQAIIQGESIPALAKRIAAQSAGQNAASMMRYARTAMTAAQNAGRQEMLQKATGMGIKCRKRWMATLDGVTRDSHAALDGEVVEVDERFSNGLMYPGDPNGPPGEVMNCRCTMTYEYDGIDNSLWQRLDNETKEMIPDMTYSEWKRMNAPEPERKQEKASKKEKTTSDFDKIMKKVDAMADKKDTWEEGKKNLLPMADEKIAGQAHDIWMSLTDGEADNLTELATIDISKLKTEQAEVFTDRLEELAEAFDGRKVSGARTEDFEGITVAKWQGEYIVLDGNNRTNLAILKGQKELEVMLIDMDGDTELRKRVEREAERRPVQGEDITDTWQRRMDKFDFEIEDVINAQGFDGLPRIMDPEDFDKAVKESGFIAQRTYSASTQEEVDLYRDMLYNGKFYVDCSTGGAQYGQGMYCAADYTGKITKGMQEEMAHYRELNESKSAKYNYNKMEDEKEEKRFKIIDELYDKYNYSLYKTYAKDSTEYKLHAEAERLLNMDAKQYVHEYHPELEPKSHTETFTLTPDAKIITFRDLEQERTYGRIEQRIYESMEGTLSPPQAKAIREWIKSDGETKISDQETRMIAQDIEERAEILMAQDPGAYAAMLGYDAINAEGHGESGSYTVILNRTKCIFRREKK